MAPPRHPFPHPLPACLPTACPPACPPPACLLQKEFLKVSRLTGIGFVAVGLIGFLVKVIFIPINQVGAGHWPECLPACVPPACLPPTLPAPACS
jgi:hypothetical protein